MRAKWPVKPADPDVGCSAAWVPGPGCRWPGPPASFLHRSSAPWAGFLRTRPHFHSTCTSSSRPAPTVDQADVSRSPGMRRGRRVVQTVLMRAVLLGAREDEGGVVGGLRCPKCPTTSPSAWTSPPSLHREGPVRLQEEDRVSTHPGQAAHRRRLFDLTVHLRARAGPPHPQEAPSAACLGTTLRRNRAGGGSVPGGRPRWRSTR